MSLGWIRRLTKTWLWQRSLHALMVLWGLASMVFVLFYVLPADSAQMTLGQRSDPETLQEIRAELGLDLPWGQRYFHFLNDLSPLSVHQREKAPIRSLVLLPWSQSKALYLKFPYLGKSYQSRRDVVTMVVDAFGGTLVLAVSAMVLATLIGITMGTLAAYTRSGWIRSLLMGLSMAGVAAPSFLISLLLAYLLGYVWGPWTGLPMSGHLWELDPWNGPQLQWRNLVLPALTLGIRPLAVVVQLTRDSVGDVLQQDYIRTARAKGLTEFKIWRRHVMPNALNPIVTALSGWLSSLLAGAVFVEYVFGWKGMGKMTVDALMVFDLPVVLGVVLWSGFLFVLINNVVDWLYTVLDPRVQLNA